MPLPLILGIGAAVASIGVGAIIRGRRQMHDARTRIDAIRIQHEHHMADLERHNRDTNEAMDNLGNHEMEILNDFAIFTDLIERIQNRPDFAPINIDGIPITHFSLEDIQRVSIGAGVLREGLAEVEVGARLGIAGGFAAAGATNAAVTALGTLGTASTGVAISSLHGAALTNATLAALGGGALATGGGGIVLGSTILGASTLGVGLLIGGIIFNNIVGSRLSDRADEAETQMLHARAEINRTCDFLNHVRTCANDYRTFIYHIYLRYRQSIHNLRRLVIENNRIDWDLYSPNERRTVETCSTLVDIMQVLCSVRIVEQAERNDELNGINYGIYINGVYIYINYNEINNAMENAENLLSRLDNDEPSNDEPSNDNNLD